MNTPLAKHHYHGKGRGQLTSTEGEHVVKSGRSQEMLTLLTSVFALRIHADVKIWGMP
jgi:hypothetical protein